jgi:hypothetical protein
MHTNLIKDTSNVSLRILQKELEYQGRRNSAEAQYSDHLT